ncbi:hypothetical protein FA13DRAFT_1794686 [Coprinellus micaceus]|uniref:NAD(P)-binding protein n=1 Tax=Coprinellus micaceus TaxID=71717 RepID=A0A4Y7T0R1_COPMI|nr:hypothetical protein FA13DRAFT_1794686 [Coprinellus micaceus]
MRFAPNTTLVTGGASQTGLALSKLFQSAGLPVLFASPSGERAPVGFECVKLDWEDVTTIPEVFDTPHQIRYVYLQVPESLGHDPLPYMQSFIDLAIAEGVQRFVLAGEKGGNAVGARRIHSYLEAQRVECVALGSLGAFFIVVSPMCEAHITHFALAEHSSVSRTRVNSIREKHAIETACSASVEDIPMAAFKAITVSGRVSTHERSGAQWV